MPIPTPARIPKMVRGAGLEVGRVEVAEVATGQRCGDDDQERGQDPLEGRLATHIHCRFWLLS
jgi:hypothetical protein